ncbi:hypothetical protein CLV58_11189 [Spirosoma oryzae]|uniref:YD repeat-containing protein n=1 Tax=Spirosoma oryzae TaxID=1469603 RepID=A0A2T0SUF8_9BACT|nr:hypothetical protein CLV58_11189 [Spirosoma oryzae]
MLLDATWHFFYDPATTFIRLQIRSGTIVREHRIYLN